MVAVRRALTSSFAVCEDLRSCVPGLSKAFVPLDKMHVSLAVVAAAPHQLQQLIQARTPRCCEAHGLLTRWLPQIFQEQSARLPQQSFSHSRLGRFRSDVVFMHVVAAPELKHFCVRLHECVPLHMYCALLQLNAHQGS